MPASSSLFELLGLAPSADDAAIRATYKRRLLELHPDRNPGFRDQATQACAELTGQFAAYSADPSSYRQEHAGPAASPPPGPGPGESGDFEVEDAIDLAGSLVELFTPAPRLDAARRAVATGAKFVRRYVRPTRG